MELTDLDALERSSNVYMIKLAMKMGGQTTYEKGGRLNINLSLFDKLREYYASSVLVFVQGLTFQMKERV